MLLDQRCRCQMGWPDAYAFSAQAVLFSGLTLGEQHSKRMTATENGDQLC